MKKILILIAMLCSVTTLVGCVENEATYTDTGYYSSGSHATYPTSSVTSGYNRDYQEKRIQQQVQQQSDYRSNAQQVQSSNGGYSSSATPKQYHTKKRNVDNGYSSSNSESSGYESNNGYSSSAG